MTRAFGLPKYHAPSPVTGSLFDLIGEAGYFSAYNTERCKPEVITPYMLDRQERHNPPLEERLKPLPPCTDFATDSLGQRFRKNTFG